MRAQITFKSGAQIEVEVTDLTTTRNRVSGALTSMEWKTPRSWTRKLHTVAVDDVVAIVMLQGSEVQS